MNVQLTLPVFLGMAVPVVFGSVHTDKPISPLEDVFYFEIEVISSGHNGLVGPLPPRIERMC
jgi:hypothetical protein